MNVNTFLIPLPTYRLIQKKFVCTGSSSTTLILTNKIFLRRIIIFRNKVWVNFW